MHLLNPSDIKWVKNIKRDGGRDWAYYDKEVGATFLLGFSQSQYPGASKIQPGEIIMLFQKPELIRDVPKETYLTHLVTPMDYSTPALNKNKNEFVKWSREVVLLAHSPKASIQNGIIGIHTHAKHLSFKAPNSGKINEVETLNRNFKLSDIQRDIWRLFEGYFVKDIDSFLINYTTDSTYNNDPEFSALEGKEFFQLKLHKDRERNPYLIKEAKRLALIRNGNRLICEACDFEFTEQFGHHGNLFIEGHHRFPIATSGERLNSPSDIAMVCSNCHRMLHRKNEFGQYYTVEELRRVVNSFKSPTIFLHPK